jgi:hypothetical protein
MPWASAAASANAREARRYHFALRSSGMLAPVDDGGFVLTLLSVLADVLGLGELGERGMAPYVDGLILRRRRGCWQAIRD